MTEKRKLLMIGKDFGKTQAAEFANWETIRAVANQVGRTKKKQSVLMFTPGGPVVLEVKPAPMKQRT